MNAPGVQSATLSTNVCGSPTNTISSERDGCSLTFGIMAMAHDTKVPFPERKHDKSFENSGLRGRNSIVNGRGSLVGALPNSSTR